MPQKIHTNKEMEDFSRNSQDISSLIPFILNPYNILQQFAYGEEDRKKLKDIWLSSDSDEHEVMTVESSVLQQDLDQLQQRGLIKYVDGLGKKIQFTSEGKGLLRESILSDEVTSYSFTKKASRDLFSRNSYDFGNEVLIKLHNPEKYGIKYIAVTKDQYKKSGKNGEKPQPVDDYNINTKDNNGNYKKLSDYTDEELIKVLHLSKRIIDNHQSIRLANNSLTSVPIHRIKSFSELIMKELNER